MRRRILLCAVTSVLSGIVAFCLWPRPRINLLLITLDTTRADRLGCYGYPAARTPVLDSLADAGVLCERAYTVAPLTLPAHTSLFTGLYPAETGVRSNGRGRLDDSIPTLAEVLKRQGYDTGGFVASFVLDSKFGLARGFNKYDDDITGSAPQADPAHRERDGESTVDGALEWLREKRSRPFFCWAHLFDPHAPYLAHADLFHDGFADRPYDAEIAYVDRQVGRLVDFLKSRGLESRTLVVVVGDHGEGLREHQEPRHGMTLYSTTLHVPLIIRQTGRLDPGRRVPGNVSIVDVSPTVLDLLGLPDPRTITGQSVAARLRGGAAPTSPCYAATDEPFLNNGWSPLRSLCEASWKYIRTTRPELYDLASDPGELHNLAAANPVKTRAMESQLAEFEARLVLRSSTGVQLRPDEKRALESLGYLGGGTASAPAPSARNLPDIKDMLPFEVIVDDAADMIGQEKFDQAIERLGDVVQRFPGYSKAHCFLAAALRKQSRFDDAAGALRALLDIKPDAVEAHYNLGLVRLEQGRDGDAVAELLKTLDLDPDFAEAHYDLAMVHVRRGNAEEALSHFDAVLEIDHCHGAAYIERGTLLVTMGRITDALADYRRALKYAPTAPSLHHNLGVVLLGIGQDEDALPHLERAVELSPRSAEFQYSLGALLLDKRQYARAVTHLAEAVELNPGWKLACDRLQQARQALSEHQRPVE